MEILPCATLGYAYHNYLDNFPGVNYPMMINLQIAKVFSGGDFKLQAITQIINFAVVPFFAFGIGKLFFSDRPLVLLGLLLTSLLPTRRSPLPCLVRNKVRKLP